MNEPTAAETLSALQFALAPLHRTVAARTCPICRNERRLYPDGYECAYCNLKPKFNEATEHENDLRHESLMADESDYGPMCNLPDDEGWRQ